MSRIALLGCGNFIGSHFLDAALLDPDTFVEDWDWDWTPAKILSHLPRPNFRFHAGDLYSQPDPK